MQCFTTQGCSVSQSDPKKLIFVEFLGKCKNLRNGSLLIPEFEFELALISQLYLITIPFKSLGSARFLFKRN